MYQSRSLLMFGYIAGSGMTLNQAEYLVDKYLIFIVICSGLFFSTKLLMKSRWI